MADELVRIHLKEPDLLVVGVLCTESARRARDLHQCMPTSAGLLGQALAAAYGIAGLLAGNARINLQLTCDGPVKGLFVDASAEGRARGYINNPTVNFLGAEGPIASSGAFGRNGVLSVLRELKAGEFYRGSVSMESFDLARDLERYYRESEQIETAVKLEVTPEGEEPLGRVAGLFVQAMPDAAQGAFRAASDALAKLPLPQSGARGPTRALDLARPLADLLPGEWEVLAEYPLAYHCECSAERVMRAVIAMGREEIADMLEKEGRAVATCAFCGSTYEIPAEQLQQILDATADTSDEIPS